MVKPPEKYDPAELAAITADLRRALGNSQRALLKAKAKREELAEVTVEACRDAVLSHWKPARTPGPRRDRRKRRAEHALWVLADWQGAKLTPSYNSDVMRSRVLSYCAKAERITDSQRADHPVEEATIVFGGDMIEGLFNFPTQPHEIDQTLFGQFVTVTRLIVDVVTYALTVYAHVTVVPEWGNHGRIGNKRDAVPRADNVDRMCYEMARQLLAHEDRLTWQECPEDIQRLEIGNYRALVCHGDEIGRNGFAELPGRLTWSIKQASGAYPWAFRDVYMHHYHTHYEMALPNGIGTLFGTGSTESDNRYASVSLASTAIPSQRLNFVDPDKGRVTAQFKVYLDE